MLSIGQNQNDNEGLKDEKLDQKYVKAHKEINKKEIINWWKQ